jgi:hypothetical protein
MKALAGGVWGTSHRILDSIGRGALSCLPLHARPRDNEALSLTGGAIVGALLGGGLGFILSDESHHLNLIAGAIIGGLVGVTTGIGWGGIVQSVDDYIRTLLNSVSRR